MTQMVNVVKKITFLMMTMALAVAMVACQAATPTPGDKGDPGTPGERGPQGEPGTTDNAPPMAIADKPFKNVYLALAGSGKMNPSGAIDPSGHFSDAEKAALTFEAMSSDAAIATVKVAAGKITVTGKAAGMATVTVSAYDGVNTDPATASFDVTVVANNIAPVITPAEGTITDGTAPTPLGAYTAADLTDAVVAATPPMESLQTLLYMVDGMRKVTLAAAFNIVPGAASDFADSLVYEVAMGAAGSGDDVVSVAIENDVAKNQWNVVLTPLKAGRQNVVITVKDKFGATHTYDSDSTDTPNVDDMTPVTLNFTAWVNSPPSLIAGMPLPDKLLVGTGTDGANTFTYYYEQYFDIDEIDKATPSLTATELGTGFRGAECSVDPDPATQAGLTYVGTAPAADVGVTADPDDADVVEGSFTLTITCTDRDATVSDTAKVTLRT